MWNVDSIQASVDSFGLSSKYFSLAPSTFLPRNHRWRSHHLNNRSYGPTMLQVLLSYLDEKHHDKLTKANETTKREREKFVKIEEARVELRSICVQPKKRQSSFDETIKFFKYFHLNADVNLFPFSFRQFIFGECHFSIKYCYKY